MSQTPTASLPPGADTPGGPPNIDGPSIDEVPPYGDPPRWRRALVVGLVLAVLVACAILAGLVVRAVWRLATGAPAPERVIMFPSSDLSYVGPIYRAEFFDGAYRQLTDLDLQIALPALHGAEADATLDRRTRELAAEVEARDSQRCFRPRLVVYGTDGRPVRTWTVA